LEYVTPCTCNSGNGETVKQSRLRKDRFICGPGESLPPWRTGFTLLEMVVAVFIISLFVAMVIPSFYKAGESRLNADARKTAALLRYLNDSAIYTKETYPLTFDIQDRRITWKGPDGEKTEDMKSLTGVTLPSKGEVTEGSVTVFFGPLGLSENVDVHLRVEDDMMTVTFNPISGRALIKQNGT
jgi:prepilin-type N-terminal cleavage/methylation domain-containing protein